MFNKKQKRRHIKALNIPENDGELKKCQLEESNLYQVPVLRNYLNIDKAIVGDIIQKYKYIFN